MGKVLSNSSSQKTHRNRFFGRSRGRSKLGTAEEGTDLADLEAGTRDFGVDDLPDIPEASGANSGIWEDIEMDERVESGGEGREGSRRFGQGEEKEKGGRIDPRTGIVSPQAVSRDSARERGELPIAAAVRGPRRAVTEQVRRP